jgi:hypothetical protein
MVLCGNKGFWSHRDMISGSRVFSTEIAHGFTMGTEVYVSPHFFNS